MIKEQSVLRSVYDVENNLIKEYVYKEWNINYYDSNNNYHIINELINQEKKQNFFVDKLLSFISIVKVHDDLHQLYFNVHHIVWDEYSSEVLEERIMYYVQNPKNKVVQKSYSNYINRITNTNMISNCTFLNDYIEKVKIYAANKDFIRNLQKFANISKKIDKKTINFVSENALNVMLEIYSQINISNTKIKHMPFINILNGRNALNYSLLGMCLIFEPNIYDIQNRSIDYNSELVCNGIPSAALFNQLLGNFIIEECSTICYFNYGGLFNVHQTKERDNISEIEIVNGTMNEVKLMLENEYMKMMVPLCNQYDGNYVKEKVEEVLKKSMHNYKI